MFIYITLLLLPYGRAYENGLSKQQTDLNELINYQKKYKIKEYEGSTYLIIKYQYISANGNVVNDGSFFISIFCASPLQQCTHSWLHLRVNSNCNW